MKLKIKDLKPNPYKKEINKGKLDGEQIKRLKSNLKELGQMGSIPIVKIKDNYHLVWGHHRVQSLKELYGNNHLVDVEVKKYSDEQLLRGMIIENLTQRANDFREEIENINAVRKFLRNRCPDSGQRRTKEGKFDKGDIVGSVRDIGKWLNKQGEVMSKSKISELLNIYDELDEGLKEEIEKTHKGEVEGRRDGGVLSYTQATMLSKIKDKEEQKDLAKALKGSMEQRVREQSKLLSKYKESSQETKRKVRKGKIDIVNVDMCVEKTPEIFIKSISEEIIDITQASAKLSSLVDSFIDGGLVQKMTLPQKTRLAFGLRANLESVKTLFSKLKENNIKISGGI